MRLTQLNGQPILVNWQNVVSVVPGTDRHAAYEKPGAELYVIGDENTIPVVETIDEIEEVLVTSISPVTVTPEKPQKKKARRK